MLAYHTVEDWSNIRTNANRGNSPRPLANLE